MSVRVLLFLTLVELLSIVGCSESDQPTAMDTRAEEQAVEQAQGGEVSQVAGTTSRVEAEAPQPEQAISNPVQQRPDPTESESEPTPALADRQQLVQSEPEQQSEPIESQEESEAPPTNLTERPGNGYQRRRRPSPTGTAVAGHRTAQRRRRSRDPERRDRLVSNQLRGRTRGLDPQNGARSRGG